MSEGKPQKTEQRKPRFATSSDIELKPYYTPSDVAADPDRDVGQPGEFPYTRGVQPTMYRGRFWTMRQYAGFASAAESNRRYRYPAGAGADRPIGRVRSADADRLRRRRSDGRRAKWARSA